MEVSVPVPWAMLIYLTCQDHQALTKNALEMVKIQNYDMVKCHSAVTAICKMVHFERKPEAEYVITCSSVKIHREELPLPNLLLQY